MGKTYRRRTFTEVFEYPEVPVPVKPRYRGFHRFDLTTCIGCEKCAVACPVDCIYIEKEKAPVGKGFRIDGFTIDYTKCMFCALCVEPCPVDCIFMGSNFDLSCYSRDGCIVDYAKLPLRGRLGPGDAESDGRVGIESVVRASLGAGGTESVSVRAGFSRPLRARRLMGKSIGTIGSTTVRSRP